jgi:hypothetical protein
MAFGQIFLEKLLQYAEFALFLYHYTYFKRRYYD